MSGLFYTDLSIPRGLNSVSHLFALETHVPGIGLLVNSNPLAISSFFTPHTQSFLDNGALAESLALDMKLLSAETKASITVTSYSIKYEDANGSLKIRPLLVVTTVPLNVLSAKSVGTDTKVMVAIEAGALTLARITKTMKDKMSLIESPTEIYKAARTALLPTNSAYVSQSALECCLGGLDISLHQKIILTNTHVGAIFVRQNLPFVSTKSLSEEDFGAMVSERMSEGLGCRVDSYVVAPRHSLSYLPSSRTTNELEAEGVVEGFSSSYVHWEPRSDAIEYVGNFMEHLTIRTIEISTLRSLERIGESLWTTSFSPNSTALVHLLPGSIALLNASIGDRYNLFLLA